MGGGGGGGTGGPKSSQDPLFALFYSSSTAVLAVCFLAGLDESRLVFRVYVVVEEGERQQTARVAISREQEILLCTKQSPNCVHILMPTPHVDLHHKRTGDMK